MLKYYNMLPLKIDLLNIIPLNEFYAAVIRTHKVPKWSFQVNENYDLFEKPN